MDALSLATNGIIVPIGVSGDIVINKIIYPLKIIRIDSIKPIINVSPIKKSIILNVKCKGE